VHRLRRLRRHVSARRHSAYEHEEGKYKPFHLEDELGLDNCIPLARRGCTTVHLAPVPAIPGLGDQLPTIASVRGAFGDPTEMAGILCASCC
jgi:hypothetical protein